LKKYKYRKCEYKCITPLLGDTRNILEFLLGNLEGRDYLGDLGIDGKTKLKWI
jgi:hypothetical protein